MFKYIHKIYGSARVSLRDGTYTLSDPRDITATLEKLNKTVKNACIKTGEDNV